MTNDLLKVCHFCGKNKATEICNTCKKPTCTDCWTACADGLHCTHCIMKGMDEVNAKYKPTFTNPEYPEEI